MLHHRQSLWVVVAAVSIAIGTSWIGPQVVQAQAPSPQPLQPEQRQTLQNGLQTLQQSLASASSRSLPDFADAAIYAKGVSWALRYDSEFSIDDVNRLNQAILRGQERLNALIKGQQPWSKRLGKLALGYVSQVDGSVQPYGLIVPKNYDPAQAMRLDVVLHGSTRPVGMSELRFMARFEEGDEATTNAPDVPYIELHPLGRVENCYRWAGETDVFEAIEDVCRRYRIDRDRIVLRGMSMGASGTWHLGLKHPDRFVALGPYCGYVDTHRFSETPIPSFIKVGPLPEHQELGLHMLDSVDYAANAGVVPAIACMGDKDVFFQAHVLMEEAMQREGLKMTHLISPGTGHVIDPITHAEQLRQIATHADRGLNHAPTELRFVTWTLKYSRCHWIELHGLDRHYARAEITAKVVGDRIEIAEPLNINRFSIDLVVLPASLKSVRIGATELALPGATVSARTPVMFERHQSAWRIVSANSRPASSKRPGLQGPIDDAFTTPFLCVRGTGIPWNPAVHDHAIASLNRFAEEWHHYFRGELPIKDDSAVTEEDVQSKNLILFGDPGSNSWITKALPQLPMTWTKEKLRLSGHEYPSDFHMPALIAPSPLPGGTNHYVVINSGHTFRGSDLNAFNYLLFPRWGDWAVVHVPSTQSVNGPLTDEVLKAGYFNEQWQAP